MEEETVKGRQLDLGSTVGVIATVALRKKVHRSRITLKCHVSCLWVHVFVFTLCSGRISTQWGATVRRIFYWGPYTSAFLHEFQVHGPVFIMGPFTFVFQLTTVHC